MYPRGHRDLNVQLRIQKYNRSLLVTLGTVSKRTSERALLEILGVFRGSEQRKIRASGREKPTSITKNSLNNHCSNDFPIERNNLSQFENWSEVHTYYFQTNVDHEVQVHKRTGLESAKDVKICSSGHRTVYPESCHVPRPERTFLRWWPVYPVIWPAV